jgi:sugar/nucleoside kinase (ribokinase family)
VSLLVAGYLTIDVECRVGSIPGFGERVTAEEMWRAHGGMAANAACAAARLGTPVRFFGHAESGGLGDESVAALEAAGVDASGVARATGGGSLCVILVGADGSRSVVSEPLEFDWTHADEALPDATALHVDGYRLDDALPRAHAVRRRGGLTSIDLDGAEDASGFDAAAGAFSVVLLNEGLAGGAPRATAERLVAAGAEIVCVTLGAAGALVATGGEIREVPGIRVDAVDTTGAGDAFAGAFLHRRLAGSDPFAAAAFANAAAALSTTARGARGRLATEAEVLAVHPIEEARP